MKIDYSKHLMTVKTWDENGEVIFIQDVSHIYKDGDNFVLEDIFGKQTKVTLQDDNVLEVS